MAIVKNIPIHTGSHLSHTFSYIDDSNKNTITGNTSPASKDLENAFAYAENLEKTLFTSDGDEEILVSGYRCHPETASFEFQISRDRYWANQTSVDGHVRGTKEGKNGRVAKESIEAYHIIQSFPDIPDLDPRLVHHIGRELCERAFADHKCVISTHLNTTHLHNHIIVCAYKESEIGKYKMDKAHLMAYRRINDQLSQEYGLPILIDNDKTHEGMSWYEWNATRNSDSWKQQIRDDIDIAKRQTHSWNEFISYMESAGYTIRQGKYVTYSMPGDPDKRCRDKTLGSDYTKEAILSGFEDIISRSSTASVNGADLATGSDRPVKDVESTPSFYVSRYSESGRRRSDLEILFLKAIKIIRYYMDKFRDVSRYESSPTNPVYHSAEAKIRAMEQSLNMCRALGIENMDQLKDLLSRTGARLSRLKKDVADLDVVLGFEDDIVEKIEKISALAPIIDQFGLSYEQLQIFHFYPHEVSLRCSSAMPMSASQRRDLYLALEESDLYKPVCRFNEITYAEAKDMILFLTGKTTSLPPKLVLKDTPSPDLDDHIDESDDDISNDDRNRNFAKILASVPPDMQEPLINYRSLLNDLASYGISPSDFESIRTALSAHEKENADLQEQIQDLKGIYRDLSRLKYNAGLAETRAFTHGSLFESDIDTAASVKPNSDTDSATSASVDTETLENLISRMLNKSGYFNDIDSSFYDRL